MNIFLLGSGDKAAYHCYDEHLPYKTILNNVSYAANAQTRHIELPDQEIRWDLRIYVEAPNSSSFIEEATAWIDQFGGLDKNRNLFYFDQNCSMNIRIVTAEDTPGSIWTKAYSSGDNKNVSVFEF